MTPTPFPQDRARGGQALLASQTFMEAARRLSTTLGLHADQLEYLILLDQAADEAWTPEEHERIQQQLAEAEESLLERTDSFVGLVKTLEALIVHDDEELAERKARRQRKRDAVERLKSGMQALMERIGQRRLNTAIHELRLQADGKPTVVVTDASKLRSEFQRTRIVIEPDRTAILAYVKATGEIPEGVEVVHGSHLVIA